MIAYNNAPSSFSHNECQMFNILRNNIIRDRNGRGIAQDVSVKCWTSYEKVIFTLKNIMKMNEFEEDIGGYTTEINQL